MSLIPQREQPFSPPPDLGQFRESMKRFVGDSLGEQISEQMRPFEPFMQKLAEMSLPKTFPQLLEKACALVAESFYRCLGEPKLHDPKLPEMLAELLVNVYLKAKYEGVGYVLIESPAANGYVDIRVSFPDREYIVELKVLDSSRSIGWAKKGLTQLDRYMEVLHRSESYLVVFDCRKTDEGEKLEPVIRRRDDRIIHVIWQRIYWPK